MSIELTGAKPSQITYEKPSTAPVQSEQGSEEVARANTEQSSHYNKLAMATQLGAPLPLFAQFLSPLEQDSAPTTAGSSEGEGRFEVSTLAVGEEDDSLYPGLGNVGEGGAVDFFKEIANGGSWNAVSPTPVEDQPVQPPEVDEQAPGTPPDFDPLPSPVQPPVTPDPVPDPSPEPVEPPIVDTDPETPPGDDNKPGWQGGNVKDFFEYIIGDSVPSSEESDGEPVNAQDFFARVRDSIDTNTVDDTDNTTAT